MTSQVEEMSKIPQLTVNDLIVDVAKFAYLMKVKKSVARIKNYSTKCMNKLVVTGIYFGKIVCALKREKSYRPTCGIYNSNVIVRFFFLFFFN